MDAITLKHNSQLNVAPRIEQQLISIDEEQLIIQHFNGNVTVSFGWGGALLFWIIGLPISLFLTIHPWLPPYGYRDGVAITSFYEKLSGVPLSGFMLYLLFFIVFGYNLECFG